MGRGTVSVYMFKVGLFGFNYMVFEKIEATIIYSRIFYDYVPNSNNFGGEIL